MSKDLKQVIPVGQKIGELVCQSSFVIGDMIIVKGEKGTCGAFHFSTDLKSPKLYSIDDNKVLEVFIPRNHELLILRTKEKEYIRDFNNQPIEESSHWADYYFEPFSESFYRKDVRNNWYDIEGFRLDNPVFLKHDILCTLVGKTSKQSISFKDQELIISPAAQLIQVGKLVYNKDLDLVHYFGEKITGLGNKSIDFGNDDVLQEVLLGVNRKAFINEFSHEPYLIDNEEIINHVKTVVRGQHRFEVFESEKRKYVVEKRSDEVFSFEGMPMNLDFKTYLKIGVHDLILARRKGEKFYMDINTKQPFSIPLFDDERVVFVDQHLIRIGKDELYDMETYNHAFVYNETKQELFSLDGGEVLPESLEEVDGFENYYAYAVVDGLGKIVYKKDATVIKLGDEKIEIGSLSGTPDDKLINATDVKGRPVVLDARKGFNQLSLAESEGRKIVSVEDEALRVGTHILQNVQLETLGGTEPRVVDLNHKSLAVFTLPSDLLESGETSTPSSFRANPILSIDWEQKLELENQVFLHGQFLSYFGDQRSCMLDQNNGKPLHLDGAGHQNELITGFKIDTLTKPYFLGHHRMVGAYTLTEDLKEAELLFSITERRSWLPFYDGYLPIFKRVVELKGQSDWEYWLFELRIISKVSEFVAVEKTEPFRLLVEKSGGKPVPKIVKSKDKTLKTPEEVSAIRRFFLNDPGYLMDVT